MTSKYYAVVSGRKPGIYTDWKTTENMIKGFPGAIFKKFSIRQDAEDFIQNSTKTLSKSSNVIHTLPLLNKTIIYTDGSFAGTTCGFGVVIITSSGDKITAHGLVPSSLSSSNNVAELYAIYVALSLVKGDVLIYTDSQYAVSSLTTHVHDWNKNGWSGVANKNLILLIFSLMKDRKITFNHVAAHKGIQYNEEADRLANEGRKGSDKLMVYKNGTKLDM